MDFNAGGADSRRWIDPYLRRVSVVFWRKSTINQRFGRDSSDPIPDKTRNIFVKKMERDTGCSYL
jgi:hypothetical protein